MAEFRMPSLGADMEAGTLTEWLVKPGDQVKRGDIVAVVETQKGAIEIEIFVPGTIERFLVDVGAKVPVGTVLAMVRGEGEAAMPVPTPPPSPKPTAMPQPAPVLPQTTAPASGAPLSLPAGTASMPASEIRASPAARHLAMQKGIDLATIAGTGPHGVIGIADVEAALKAPAAGAPPAKARSIGIDLDQMRIAIAAGMARSKREIPHYYLQHSLDLSAAEAWLAKFNEARPPAERALMAAIVLKAVARAAKRFPAFNGFYREGKYEPAPDVHIGMAIAIRGGGLMAPAIHDADGLSVGDLMTAMRDLVQRARVGRIRSSEIADPTITVSSLGDRGVEALYGVIYPPQVAVVGVGKVVTRPWAVSGEVAARPVLTITLSADHRVSDGHAGGQFLAAIGELLEEPEKL